MKSRTIRSLLAPPGDLRTPRHVWGPAIWEDEKLQPSASR
ncbi:hypothetical protein AVEN_153145-1, partial [Araneus ventricosus]